MSIGLETSLHAHYVCRNMVIDNQFYYIFVLPSLLCVSEHQSSPPYTQCHIEILQINYILMKRGTGEEAGLLTMCATFTFFSPFSFTD